MQYDFVSFFRALLADPYRVGAITSSRSALADLITLPRERALSSVRGLAYLLPPSRGVVVREENVALAEYGSDFVRLLQFRFPDAHVL